MGITLRAVLIGVAISLASFVHANSLNAQGPVPVSGAQDGGEASQIKKLLDATPRMAEAGAVPTLIDG